MDGAARRYLTAGTALALGSVVAVTPVAPHLPETPVLSLTTRLTAGDASIFNIPFNLFQDIVNVPGNEVGALNLFADSLFHTGSWVVASATNLWGEDPGDPGRFMAMTDMLVPFSAISGLGQPEIDPTADAAGTAGLGQQLALLIDAELPVSASSSATWTDPLGPVPPITGLTSIDRPIWFLSAATGLQQYPLFANWFKVPISDLTSGNFNFGNVVDPSSGVGPGGAVLDSFGLPGTHVGTLADGTTANLMPWSNLDFKLDLAAPFQNFLNSLMASPNLNGFDIPTFEEIGRTLQSLVAGSIVDFDAYVPGNVLSCPGACALPEFLTQEGLVRAIGDLWPGNTTIDTWLQLADAGQANGPTQAGINFANEFFTGAQQWFDFGNPLPNSPLNPDPVPVGPALQSLIDFMQASGIQNFIHGLADASGFTPVTYPLDLSNFTPPPDWLSILLGDLGVSGFTSNSPLTLIDFANPTNVLTDLNTLLSGLGVGDINTLLGDLGLGQLATVGGLGAEIGSQLPALSTEIGTQLPALSTEIGALLPGLGTDVGAQLPSDLTSMLLSVF